MSNDKFVVAALYKFVYLEDYERLQEQLMDLCKLHGIKGTLLLAIEGVNGTVAGTRPAIDALKAFFENNDRFNGWEYKESSAAEMPFYRMKVRLKKEIVTMGLPAVDPNKVVGTYVEPEDWNDLLKDPEVLVIDTRNDYEVKIGKFSGAIDPQTDSFREFPKYVRENIDKNKQKKVAMYCTGGIRCEKASSFMKAEGFEEVYHLKGGILKYLETIPQDESLWEGECFVFDQRVAVKHGLEEGEHQLCYSCRAPLSPEDLRSAHYAPGVQCPYCHDLQDERHRKRAKERHEQVLRAKTKCLQHIGDSATQ
jgi:UPF0176 protein